jgi:ADP-ribose pyrophosphatase YjhB (NUDIX family)
MKSYITRLRKKIGHGKIIHPAARIIIENARGEYLFIRRKDNGRLGIPAGGFEENESIEACIRREVREETGLELIDLEVIGISSVPAVEMVSYPNGDVVQYFTIEFYSNQWEGIPRPDHEETSEIIFLGKESIALLPANEKRTFESLRYYRETGKIRLE